MTREEFISAVEAADRLSDFVLAFTVRASVAPYYMNLSDKQKDYLSVYIDGDDAVISYPEVNGGYDECCELTLETTTVPLDAIFLSPDDFLAHCRAKVEDQRKEAHRESMERAAQEAAAREIDERNMLSHLKKKYE